MYTGVEKCIAWSFPLHATTLFLSLRYIISNVFFYHPNEIQHNVTIKA
uniref:Uncharacterized protein n=1 Tax=Anguilla anguilla TaxID=7936 RepID=A0A0E9S8J3_ANGAN